MKGADLKTVVITGAAQGVGLATASLLARAEYRVVLLDLQSVDAHVDRLRGDGAQVAGLSGDISSEAFVQQLAQWIHREYGAAYGLVNNAGISLIGPAEETSAAQWQRVMDVNLFGPFLLSKYLGAQMLECGRGSIVNVASIAGLAGVSHRSAYNASKHGLVGLTKTLASEWGGRGVRVNAVCPGWIKTEMDAADQGSGAYSDADIVDRVPMARFARVSEVAEAIAFLLDHERAGFINGISLPVDGGWTADASWESLRIRTRD
ncbi:MAG: short-chain dehydrogenase [Gammaproteobacteria bacterium]|nr:short-chain dehydrogenase [Gammaproteobacteria bacterium]